MIMITSYLVSIYCDALNVNIPITKMRIKLGIRLVDPTCFVPPIPSRPMTNTRSHSPFCAASTSRILPTVANRSDLADNDHYTFSADCFLLWMQPPKEKEKTPHPVVPSAGNNRTWRQPTPVYGCVVC